MALRPKYFRTALWKRQRRPGVLERRSGRGRREHAATAARHIQENEALVLAVSPCITASLSLRALVCMEKRNLAMLRKMFAPLAVVFAAGLAWMAPLTPISVAQAAPPECKTDTDCAAGNFCILALTPHVCKPPQPAGATCKRDVVCESKKCEIPSGKEVGACK